MPVNDRFFLRQEPGGFVEDFVGDANFADVVQQRGHLDFVAAFRRQTDAMDPGRAGQCHAQAVARRGLVLPFQRREQAAGDSEAHLDQGIFLFRRETQAEVPFRRPRLFEMGQ